jgi:hypothetical protein
VLSVALVGRGRALTSAMRKRGTRSTVASQGKERKKEAESMQTVQSDQVRARAEGRPSHAGSRHLPRTITAAVAGLVVGALLGAVVATAAVGLLPFALGGTLACSVNGDGTVTTCTNANGQPVQVPHRIRIRQ